MRNLRNNVRTFTRYRDVIRAVVALAIAAAFIKTGITKLPTNAALTNVVATTNQASGPGADARTFFSERGQSPQDPTPTTPVRTPLSFAPILVYSEPMLAPLVVTAKKLKQTIKRHRGPFDRAPVGEKIRVSLTQYCLQGTTRRSNAVRLGIVAADPRVFPLARYVEVFLGKHHLGTFLVDDTGGKVKGATLDIWNPSCSEARRFGRRWGTARLVAK